MLPEKKKKEKTISFYSLKRVCILLVMSLTVNDVCSIQKDSHTRQIFDMLLVMCHKELLTAIVNFLVHRAYHILLHLYY